MRETRAIGAQRPNIMDETKTEIRSVPLSMTLGLGLLWLMFFPGLVAWWLLMSALFQEGAYLTGVVVAYALPVFYVLATFIAERRRGHWIKMLHFGTFLIFGLSFIGALVVMGVRLPSDDAGPYLSIAFIAAVMALMQYPVAGFDRYYEYRKPLFLAGVIFMPLFIYLAAMLSNVPHTPGLDKVYLFPLGMLGFWLSAAWLAIKATQGSHVPGLELRPLLPFRPDFILPGGVNYVKGTIMMGVGLMIAIHPKLGMPQWNWWGFVLAFWGIITVIPLRGMYKMALSRRMRLLGLGGTGLAHELTKSLILFIGLLIMLYGFVNAFFGTVPFAKLGVLAQFNTFNSGTTTGQIISVVGFLLAFVVLVPLRSWHKTRLLEGVETNAQLFIKQVWLWAGTLLMLIGFVHLLNLPPIRNAGFMAFYPKENPVGFVVGTILFLAGSALVLILRPIALRNELEATMKIMVGVASDQPPQLQEWMLRQRIHALAAMPEDQRDQHFRWMAAGLSQLKPDARKSMMGTQMLILAEAKAGVRQRCMRSLDKTMAGGG